MPVSVIGIRNTGKSVLIGLLAQAMDNYAIMQVDKENKKKFGYWADSGTLRVINGLKSDLIRGNWPIATITNDLSEIKILLGFRPDIVSKFRGWIDDPKGKYGKLAGMIFGVYDISGEDILEASNLKTSSLSNEIQQLFNANVAIIIIDCSKFTNADPKETTKGRELQQYDSQLSEVISKYQEYRRLNMDNERVVPILFLVQADNLDPEILSKFSELQNMINRDWNANGTSKKDVKDIKKIRSTCSKTGQRLMRKHMKTTYNMLENAELMGIDTTNPPIFFSWINTDYSGKVIPFDVTPKPLNINDEKFGYRTDFPIYIYYAFLDYLRDISLEYCDSDKLVAEYLGPKNELENGSGK